MIRRDDLELVFGAIWDLFKNSINRRSCDVPKLPTDAQQLGLLADEYILIMNAAKCSLRSNTEGNTGSAELVKKRRAC